MSNEVLEENTESEINTIDPKSTHVDTEKTTTEKEEEQEKKSPKKMSNKEKAKSDSVAIMDAPDMSQGRGKKRQVMETHDDSMVSTKKVSDVHRSASTVSEPGHVGNGVEQQPQGEEGAPTPANTEADPSDGRPAKKPKCIVM